MIYSRGSCSLFVFVFIFCRGQASALQILFRSARLFLTVAQHPYGMVASLIPFGDPIHRISCESVTCPQDAVHGKRVAPNVKGLKGRVTIAR